MGANIRRLHQICMSKFIRLFLAFLANLANLAERVIGVLSLPKSSNACSLS